MAGIAFVAAFRRGGAAVDAPASSSAEASVAARGAPFRRLTEGGGLGPGGARRVTVAAGADGLAVAAWATSDRTGAGGVFVADESDSGFRVSSPSEALPGRGDAPAVATSAAGAVVAWLQILDTKGSVLVAQRAGPRAQWQAPASLEDRVSFAPHAYEPVIAVAADGEQLLVWNQWTGANFGVAFARRTVDGAWKRPRAADDVVSPLVFYANGPRLAVGRDGRVIVTWYQSPDGGALMVYASERTSATSALSTPAPSQFVSKPVGPVSSHPIANPRPAIAPDGRAAIAWTQDTGPGEVARVYVAERDATASFARGARIDVLSPGDAIARGPQLAFGARGDLFVVWEEKRGDATIIVGARQDESGAWVGPPRMLSRASRVAVGPVLAAGNRGLVLAAWSERDERGWVTVTARTESGRAFGEVEEIGAPRPVTTDPAVAVSQGSPERLVVAWIEGQAPDGRIAIAASP